MLTVCSALVFMIFFSVVFFYSSKSLNYNNFSSNSSVSPYECGFVSCSLSFNSFSFSYFVLLVFFVIFDLEISLLLNLPEQSILFKNYLFYLTFLLVLALGFCVEVYMG
uniref:NADH-ubiquinone oxidoreductase chain 3 n=1 Tax=Gyrocotyle urna TaxID=82851 RepID=R4I255_9CEST|nr:NADH dehydrogenase subunit 3 [Gyrocotyle urna]